MIEGDATAFENIFMEALCLHENKPMLQNTLVYRAVYEQQNDMRFDDAATFVKTIPLEQRMIDHFRMTQIAHGKFYDANQYRQFTFNDIVHPAGFLSSRFSRAMNLENMRDLLRTDFNAQARNYGVHIDNDELCEITQSTLRYR